MWTFAHIVFAYLFGRGIDKKKDWHLDRGLWLCLLIAGDIPDFDSTIADIFSLGSSFHGGVTHTIVGALVLGLILGVLFWVIESVIYSRRVDSERTPWNMHRLAMYLSIAILGALIHLVVDIGNTSNEYARAHHLYLWPISDYSFHLDLMLAGMPDNRMAAWAYRPLVNIILAIINALLITWLWFTHVKSDKHFWDFLFSEDIEQALSSGPNGVISKVQFNLDKNRKVLNMFLMVVITIAFIGAIITRIVRATMGM